MDYCVVTFSSTYGAIFAQNLLKGVCPVQVMPVLRELSSGCGISLRLEPQGLEQARETLAASTLPAEEYAFFGVTGAGRELRTEPL